MSWRGELLAVWAVTLRNALMGARNVFFFFELLFWPIVGVLSIGLMSRFLELTPAQASFVLIGTIALSIVNVCQLEVAYAVLLDVWSKSLKHQFLAPIGIRHLTLGSWVIGMLRGLLVFGLLAVLGRWAFGFDVLQPGWIALATFLLGCFLTGVYLMREGLFHDPEARRPLFDRLIRYGLVAGIPLNIACLVTYLIYPTGLLTLLSRITGVIRDTIEGRILNGYHFRSADVQGAWLGKKVAQYLDSHYFQPVD